ncbi:MAG: DUF3943 domain-containing protein, partial [Prevotellaceae bacterium]|nr:DUF3943 domain-containing protein [Prevotellaceae bacterium]
MEVKQTIVADGDFKLMKKKVTCLIIMILSVWSMPVQAQYSTTFLHTDSIKIQRSAKKNYWRPAVEIIGLNTGIWAFDRYVLNEDWARISASSIKRNMKQKFIWDNDMFATNLFAHPYHGGLYFNAARSNGLSFWQSVPLTFGGSYMWELIFEKQPPSLNDIIATPIGGVAMGEITHRFSRLFLDDSKRGWERLGREFVAGIISPVDLLNRILSGKAWKYHSPDNDGYTDLSPLFQIRFSVANRFMSDLYENKSIFNMSISAETVYGEIFTGEPHSPYDYFKSEINANPLGKQPLLSDVSIIGLIWGREWNRNGANWMAGIFQHFDYYDSNPVVEGSKRPYEFAETASFGGGLIYANQRNNRLSNFKGELFANLVLLGASESDYCVLDKRNYNLGNGYSFKFNGMFSFGKKFDIAFGFKHYHIFTSIGYGSVEAEMNGLPEDSEIDYANVQGNKGRALLDKIHIDTGFQLSKRIRI